MVMTFSEAQEASGGSGMSNTTTKKAPWYENLIKTGGEYDFNKIAGLAGLGGSALGFFDSSQPSVGYQGSIPNYTAMRSRVPDTFDPNRRPGSGGQRYFSDVQYVPQGDTGASQATQSALATEVAGLAALNRANPAQQVRPPSVIPDQPTIPTPVSDTGLATLPTIPSPESLASGYTSPYQTYANGGGVKNYDIGGLIELIGQNPQILDYLAYTTAGTGLAGIGSVLRRKFKEADKKNFNVGGMASRKQGKYLDGKTDGMADEIPAMIDNEQPAMLSDGEFVIPADVVSHLGNGNSDAGAKVLEDMMDRVRKARTGTKEQGPEIDPKEFLPA
jgi:hypothetical protein